MLIVNGVSGASLHCINFGAATDPCCGTAGFLVAAMHHMLEKAGADQNKRKNIKKKQLHGFELQSNMFAIAATNMILRDDGNSNIKCEDFLRQNPAQVQLKGATVGMMNPPYSQGTKSDPSQYELSFVEHLLDSLTEGARAAVIVPQSSMTGKTKDEQTFNEYRSLDQQGIYIYIKSRKRSIQRRKSLKLIKSLWKRCTLSIRECKYEYRNKTVIFNSGLV